MVKIDEPNMNTLDNIASGSFLFAVKNDWEGLLFTLLQVGLSETMTLIFGSEMVSTLVLVEHLSRLSSSSNHNVIQEKSEIWSELVLHE